uniref:NADH dehydrogenase [ubiquinone] 1 beta subcomplex subunit 10 n=1 Tax=Arion vulgaris TaxID=1028688 RepID=A0A0B6ZK88_9EUPU
MGGHDDDKECHEQHAHKEVAPSGISLFNIGLTIFGAIDGPVTYFREKVVQPFQAKNKEKFYHRKFNRVPTFDQCDFEDPMCIYEADEQYYRDKLVDNKILKILRQRKIECYAWEGPDAAVKCKKFVDTYEDAATNWFIKYGDIRPGKGSREAYMKQKHRLIWERRHPDRKLH